MSRVQQHMSVVTHWFPKKCHSWTPLRQPRRRCLKRLYVAAVFILMLYYYYCCNVWFVAFTGFVMFDTRSVSHFTFKGSVGLCSCLSFGRFTCANVLLKQLCFLHVHRRCVGFSPTSLFSWSCPSLRTLPLLVLGCVCLSVCLFGLISALDLLHIWSPDSRPKPGHLLFLRCEHILRIIIPKHHYLLFYCFSIFRYWQACAFELGSLSRASVFRSRSCLDSVNRATRITYVGKTNGLKYV